MRFSKNNSIHVLYIPDDADMGYLHVLYMSCILEVKLVASDKKLVKK